MNSSSPSRSLLFLYGAILLAFAVLLGWHHWKILTLPTPMDLYEGLMPLITGLIAAGENPYTLEYQPVYDDSYPPLYNLLVAPFTFLFENNYILHRAVSGVLILISCGLVYQLVTSAYKEKGRISDARLHACAAAVLLYAALIFYSTPIASTNALGVLLLIATASVPWWCQFGMKSLLFAALIGVLAFYAKQYFAVGAAFLAIYVFLFISKQRALIFVFVYLTMLILSLWLVHRSSPYFLDNTLWSVMGASGDIRSLDVLIKQLQTFLLIYGSIFAVFIIGSFLRHKDAAEAIAGGRARGEESRSGLKVISVLDSNQPLLNFGGDAHRYFFWFMFAGTSLLVIGSLGWHPANFMSYLFQLMSPFFLIALFREQAVSRVSLWLLLPALAFSLYSAWDILRKDFTVDHRQWAKAEQLILEHDNILASQIFLLPLMKHDKVINQAGHTFYFKFAAAKPEFFVHKNPEHRIEAVWNRYMAELYRQVESRELDLVMLHEWDLAGIFLDPPPNEPGVSGPDYFKRFYRLDGTIRVSLTKRPGGGWKKIQIWKPKS